MKHPVPSPCGTDEKVHRFDTELQEPLRFLLLRFQGIHDSHYIGINRIKLFADSSETVLFKVLMADGSKESADAAKPVAEDGGWWAIVERDHSLLLQLAEEAKITQVGVWCANAGATPKEIEICDARPHFPEICAAEEPKELDISCSQAPPVVHKIPSGCGKSDDECDFFKLEGPSSKQPTKHVLIRFKGIHNSHYIGINRLRLYNGDNEVMFKVLAADSNTSEAKLVTKSRGWWAVIGHEHFLVLELPEEMTLTSIGLWCANLGATPEEMEIVSDFGWIEDLIKLLEKLSSDETQGMGPKARKLIESNAGLLSSITRGHERLLWALMVRVWSGEAPKFPIAKQDALGRLQAKVFCDTCRWSQTSVRLLEKGIAGMDWQSFDDKMPSLEETVIEVSTCLLWHADEHAPEWLGTGLYVPPGGKITVTADSSTDGWSVRVGAHTDDISCKDEWLRWPQVSLILPLADPKKALTLATPFGGNVYLVRSSKASESLRATFSGNIVKQPEVSVQGVDKAILNSPGGWVDCEGQKVILTLPVHAVKKAIEAGADIPAALDFYDRLWSCYNELSPHTDPRPQRIVPDVQISIGFMHSGYPIMTHFEGTLDTSDANPITKILDFARLKKEGSWGLFHELGHNMQRSSWTFEGTVEVTVNLFTLWGLHSLCDPIEKPHPDFSTNVPTVFVKRGCPRENWNGDPFLALRTYAQVIKSFGWEALQATFKRYAEEKEEVPRNYAEQVKSFVRFWSLELRRDIRPHWRQWGFKEELKDVDPELDKLKPWSFF